jgi:hypothetical protein
MLYSGAQFYNDPFAPFNVFSCVHHQLPGFSADAVRSDPQTGYQA